ncbi:glutamate--tRNA ligase [Candidatus Kaiserbacteria bacterium]|nr:glutamate--tRNA ligase [Candidatus Kaiserbacteria bacterium]
MNPVTRIAPSPTGYLHFGLARTALFCYLFAKKNSGSFILRIEDTDLERNRPEFEADIFEQFAWLGLNADKTFKQSEHRPRHTEVLTDLIARDLAYVSREPAKDDASKEVEVIRLRNSGQMITFTDLIRGDITFDTTELGDFVIARSMSEPLYHLAVVVDDHDEGVTHVIRGEDHVSNTQRHILLHQALGFEVPAYAHLPLILMPDKSKMSKRREGSSVRYYREQGILPHALINYVALLGWNPGTEQEIFTLQELIELFEISSIHKSGAVFDVEKLRWYNKQYLARLSDEEFAAYALPALRTALEKRGVDWNDSIALKTVPVLRERIAASGDIAPMAEEGEFDYFFKHPEPDSASIVQKKSTAADASRHLQKIHEVWSALAEESFADHDRLKESVWEYATSEGRGNVLWPLRYSLSGREKSPDPFMIASIIGKHASLERISNARQRLGL